MRRKISKDKFWVQNLSKRNSCISICEWYNVLERALYHSHCYIRKFTEFLMKEVMGMSETRYLISEMSKLLQLEPHVLRYWEEELGFDIGRNDMGHRYYTEKDLQRFFRVKELKKDGMQLREIKEQFAGKDTKIVDFCGKEAKKEEEATSEAFSSKEKSFYEIMERMIVQISQSDKKEARYRRLDEAIRRHQQSRKMVAATQENEKGTRKKKSKEEKQK